MIDCIFIAALDLFFKEDSINVFHTRFLKLPHNEGLCQMHLSLTMPCILHNRSLVTTASRCLKLISQFSTVPLALKILLFSLVTILLQFACIVIRNKNLFMNVFLSSFLHKERAGLLREAPASKNSSQQ